MFVTISNHTSEERLVRTPLRSDPSTDRLHRRPREGLAQSRQSQLPRPHKPGNSWNDPQPPRTAPAKPGLVWTNLDESGQIRTQIATIHCSEQQNCAFLPKFLPQRRSAPIGRQTYSELSSCGVTMILQCSSGSPSVSNAPATPSRPTRPVTIGPGLMPPLVMASRVSAYSSGV